jgi:ubiquinone/menaquinone biosynthesis C-methylase UbiE
LHISAVFSNARAAEGDVMLSYSDRGRSATDVKEGGSMDEIVSHYSEATEYARLASGVGLLERERMLEILCRFLPEPPATILDVGGGAGVYAFPLAERGHHVHLIDLTPLHVEQARQLMPDAVRSRFEAHVGDARKLDREAETADGYLLLGPLYHLTERADRVSALREARRILKSGGTLVAAAITRFASLLDGLTQGFIEDPCFFEMLMSDLSTGQHRNPSGNPDYFTTAYFHRPEELEDELAEAGFRGAQVIAVQGPGRLRKDFDRHWETPDERLKLLTVIRAVESERSLLAVSPHVIAVARKG